MLLSSAAFAKIAWIADASLAAYDVASCDWKPCEKEIILSRIAGVYKEELFSKLVSKYILAHVSLLHTNKTDEQSRYAVQI